MIVTSGCICDLQIGNWELGIWNLELRFYVTAICEFKWEFMICDLNIRFTTGTDLRGFGSLLRLPACGQVATFFNMKSMKGLGKKSSVILGAAAQPVKNTKSCK